MRVSRSFALATTGLAMLCAAPFAYAHEFWIEPVSFTPDVGDKVPLRLFVGTGGARDELPRRSDHMLRFEAVTEAGTVPVVGLLGRAPAGLLRPVTSGPQVVVYRGRHTFIELPAEKFESYLEEEGLSRVIAERVRRDESLAPGRENYARYAKSLVFVGGEDEAGGGAVDAEIGLPIEIVPETDPRTWRPGDVFAVRLVYDGRGLADQQVKLIHLNDRGIQLVARTDADGRAELRPPQPGPWLVASVFMRRSPEGAKEDWESFWASLTFELAD